MADFIDSFIDFTDGAPSPYVFRLWAGISACAGALERRVWVKALPKPTFPNLFVLLVAAPGIGKGVIDDVEYLWRKTKGLRVAADSVTSASMLDELMDARRVVLKNGAPEFEYHSLLVASEEFGVLLPAHDLEFLSRLNRIYTNPETLQVRRKYLKETVDIIRPQLNIIAGTQPGYIASLLPEEAWSMGFTQRLLLVHASISPKVALFGDFSERDEKQRKLLALMTTLTQMRGQLQWEPTASAALQAWDSEGGPPRPTHSRLTHYINRRTQIMLKLMIISSASRASDDIVRHFDFERALAWLKGAEATMPDVFREMTQKSDTQTVQELLYFMQQVYLRGKKPVHEARLVAFLASRVPSERVMRILEIAERGEMIKREPANCDPPSKYFVPNLKSGGE